MRDIKLDETTWDIFVNEHGDMELIDGIDALRQRLRIKLQHVQGEWFADIGSGIIRYSMFGEKNPDIEAIKTYLKQEIENDAEIIAVTEITAHFSSINRQLSVSFNAETVYGLITQIGVQ